MRLNETALRRRLNAICTGRDDRLIVLLSLDSAWLMQREAVHWVRALRANYDDALEIAVLLRDQWPQKMTGSRLPQASCFFSRLRRLGVPVVVTLPDGRTIERTDVGELDQLQDTGLYAALRVPFERWSLWGDNASASSPSMVELPTGLLMRLSSHDLSERLSVLTRQLFNSADARRVILDLNMPGQARMAQLERATELAESILEHNSQIGGVSLGQWVGEEHLDSAAIDGASDRQRVEAALKALEHAVHHRRIACMTRSPRILRSGL